MAASVDCDWAPCAAQHSSAGCCRLALRGGGSPLPSRAQLHGVACTQVLWGAHCDIEYAPVTLEERRHCLDGRQRHQAMHTHVSACVLS